MHRANRVAACAIAGAQDGYSEPGPISPGYVLENRRLTVSGEAPVLQNDPAVRAAYLGAAH